MHAPGHRHRIGYERAPRLNEDVDHRSRPHPCQCPCCTGLRSRPRRRMDTRIRMPGSVTTASATAPHHHPISSGLAASRLAAPRIATPAPRPNKTLAAVGVRGGSEYFPHSGMRNPGFARVNRTSDAALIHAAKTNKTTPRTTWTTDMAASLQMLRINLHRMLRSLAVEHFGGKARSVH